MPKSSYPILDTLKRLAKRKKAKTGMAHARALDEAAREYGYSDYRQAHIALTIASAKVAFKTSAISATVNYSYLVAVPIAHHCEVLCAPGRADENSANPARCAIYTPPLSSGAIIEAISRTRGQ
ncbi:hypothetical protein [Novosphingobium resinovorum]|uniref:hypothetical protein n=1 Tax=Novosphingobium resinovorum TaxID=158500 RepID=UPI002ED10BB8|nr:hypothetical protein [Novosphingobium resinovorum]